MSVKVPKGYRLECVEAKGILEMRDGEVVFSLEDKIYDAYLEDTIAEVVYLDARKAIEEFGVDKIEKILKGEKVATEAKVCIFKKGIFP